jgi:hypothetical protein
MKGSNLRINWCSVATKYLHADNCTSDVANLVRNSQFRGIGAAANAQKVPVNLIVSQNTVKLSKPLIKLITGTGGKIQRYNSITGTLTTLYP